MFKARDAISSYLTSKPAESCASHNMLKLTRKLFDVHHEGEYMDYYENVLHNHLLSAASHTDDGGTTYFMPLEPAGRKQFDTSENTCCHGTGLETLFRFQKDIYAFSDDSVYVNLFYPSEVTTENIAIRQLQANNYHLELRVTIPPEKSLKIRQPQWAKILQVKLDNISVKHVKSEYIEFKKPMKDSKITIDLQPYTRLIPANDDPTSCSIAYGREILVELSEDESYHVISSASIKKGISKVNNKFYLENRELIPLNLVNDEAYHAYFKIE